MWARNSSSRLVELGNCSKWNVNHSGPLQTIAKQRSPILMLPPPKPCVCLRPSLFMWAHYPVNPLQNSTHILLWEKLWEKSSSSRNLSLSLQNWSDRRSSRVELLGVEKLISGITDCFSKSLPLPILEVLTGIHYPAIYQLLWIFKFVRCRAFYLLARRWNLCLTSEQAWDEKKGQEKVQRTDTRLSNCPLKHGSEHSLSHFTAIFVRAYACMHFFMFGMLKTKIGRWKHDCIILRGQY